MTVVAAAGNNSFNASRLIPASYDEVITVSALADTDGVPGGLGGNACYSWGTYDKDDTFADFSNYGADVDLIAPGKCIWSTLPGNRYGYLSGTSMAAPHVTGAVALYKASRPRATPSQVRAALRAAGTQDWSTSTDPDGVHEPLLDVARIVALGDWTVDATSPTRALRTGATVQVPVYVVRAEDVTSDVALSVDAPPGFGATLSAPVVGPGATTAALTVVVPPSPATGTYSLSVQGTVGAVTRSVTVTVRVDGDAPDHGRSPPDRGSGQHLQHDLLRRDGRLVHGDGSHRSDRPVPGPGAGSGRILGHAHHGGPGNPLDTANHPGRAGIRDPGPGR